MMGFHAIPSDRCLLFLTLMMMMMITIIIIVIIIIIIIMLFAILPQARGRALGSGIFPFSQSLEPTKRSPS